METAAKISGYNPTKTIGQVAREWAESLEVSADEAKKASMEDDDFEFDCYGIEKLTVIEVTIAGGGPGADVAFTFGPDGGIRGAVLRYYEMDGSAEVTLSDSLTDGLMTLWGIDSYNYGPSDW